MIFVCRNGHGHSSDSDAAVAGNGVFSHARGRLTFFELGSMADREQILRATSATQSWLATRETRKFQASSSRGQEIKTLGQSIL